jgi:hypothetical protein
MSSARNCVISIIEFILLPEGRTVTDERPQKMKPVHIAG